MLAGAATVGHPIDVASGAVYLTRHDFRIDGRMPIVWDRRYSTAHLGTPTSGYGPGWTGRYLAYIQRTEHGYEFHSPEGDVSTFAAPHGDLDPAEPITDFATFQALTATPGALLVTRWQPVPGEIQRLLFEPTANDRFLLSAIEDATGNRVDVLRGNDGRLLGLRQSRERRALFIEYSSTNLIETVILDSPTAGRQPVLRYDYDGLGRLIAAHDPLGHTDRYEYDDQHRLTRETLKGGGDFEFSYDSAGRCVDTRGRDGYDAKRLRYFIEAGWTEVIDSRGEATLYQLLPTGQVHRRVDPLGGTWGTAYDAHGRIVEETDPTGASTCYQYDEAGNRSALIDALGNETRFEYDDHHRMTRLIDPAGGEWTNHYDDASRWTATSDPAGHTWRFTYYPDGDLATITDPRGATQELTHSPDGTSWRVTDPLGHDWFYSEDATGRIAKVTNPLGHTTTYTHDLLGRLLGVASPDGSTVSLKYDAAGNRTELVNGLGQVTTTRYGSCRRLLERLRPDGTSQKYFWGSEPGELKRIENERAESYLITHDSAGRIASEVCFDGTVKTFRYDAAGRCIASATGAGPETEYTRDARGRLLEVLVDGVSHAAFVYDVFGNVVEARNAETEVAFERDPRGRVVRERQAGVDLFYEWDGAGNLLSISSDCGQIEYEVGPTGLVDRAVVTPGLEWRLHRDALGREIARALPGGNELRQTYDDAGLLASQRVRSVARPGTTQVDDLVVGRTYVYDAAGRPLEVEDTLRGASHYRYDAVGRVLTATRDAGPSERFQYDAAGNLTAVELTPPLDSRQAAFVMAPGGEAGVAFAYGKGNRLIRHGQHGVEMDDAGRLLRRSLSSEGADPLRLVCDWAPDGDLASAEGPGGARAEYIYDPFGRRLWKRGEDGATRFVWCDDVVIHEVSEADVTTYLYDLDRWLPVAIIQQGEPLSVLTDHVGTPRELIDSRARIRWALTSTTWGADYELQVGGSVTCNLRAQGRTFDQETGLHYNRYRYYDPLVGRFISPDPIGLFGGLNEYSFGPNPLVWVDPLGLIIVYRNLRPDESTSAGLQARRPGRGMSPAGHVRNGSTHNGSQFISTTTDPAVAAQWREPGQVTVRFDTDNVVPDARGNLSVTDLSTPERAAAAGLRGPAANYAAASSEVLVEGRVQPSDLEVVDPEEC